MIGLRKQRLQIEKLENRRLLAADIVVQVAELVVDGNIGTSVVRIFNNGDQDAEDVQINNQLTNQFVDPVWRRERGFAQIVRTTEDNGSEPTIHGEPLRDINGDGLDDFYIRMADDSGAIVWGGAFTNDEFTDADAVAAIKADMSGSLGVIVPPPGDASRNPQANLPATFIGDINNDGFADLAVNRQYPSFGVTRTEIMLGGPDLADRAAEDFFELSVRADAYFGLYPTRFHETATFAGDLNDDGIDDLVVWNQVSDEWCGFSCTANDRELYNAGLLQVDVSGEVLVVLGRSEFPSVVDRTTDDVFSYEMAGQPTARVADVNGDSMNDLISNRAVYFGGSLERSPLGDSPFNGENGFDLLGIHLPSVPLADSSTGEGDIVQLENIPAGESLIYHTSGTVQPSPAADLDGNGEVGFSDFLILSNNFGRTTGPRLEGDINEDGEVNFADFLLLSSDFGRDVRPHIFVSQE